MSICTWTDCPTDQQLIETAEEELGLKHRAPQKQMNGPKSSEDYCILENSGKKEYSPMLNGPMSNRHVRFPRGLKLFPFSSKLVQ